MRYVVGLQAKEIICGFDYTYGHKARGTAETLKQYAANAKIGCTIVEQFIWDDEKISSTRIRQCIETGNVKEIPRLLGSYYTTEYCPQSGVLPYYSLPRKGLYQVLVNTEQELIPCLATVLCQKKVQFHSHRLYFPSVVTVQWVDNDSGANLFPYKV